MEEHLKKIITFYKKHKRMPGYGEMMELTGFKSKNAVFKLINKLVERGVVDKDGRGKLIPRNLFGAIPLLGVVEAGLPSPAEEAQLDSINLDEYLIKKSDKTYLLQVKGDSMIEAHIAEGDLVLCERTEQADPGNIVIAEVDGEWTMKYLRKKGERVWLEPANSEYKAIHPRQSFRIGAVVKAVIRKYK